jgi:hypothetical protein
MVPYGGVTGGHGAILGGALKDVYPMHVLLDPDYEQMAGPSIPPIRPSHFGVGG